MSHRTTLDLDLGAPRDCPACGWAGLTSNCIELFEELLDIRCPHCDKKLGPLYLFPTVDEIREAAAAGNPRAIEELECAERMEARWARTEQLEIRDASSFPDVPGAEQFVVDWYLVREPDDQYVVLRVGNLELGRELAIWEGLPRFQSIAALLRERYGRRVTELRPDDNSQAAAYLLGDRLSWVHGIEKTNAETFG